MNSTNYIRNLCQDYALNPSQFHGTPPAEAHWLRTTNPL